MATLIVIGYESEVKAEEVRIALLKMQKDFLIDVADAVVAVRTLDGKVQLRQMYNLTVSGASMPRCRIEALMMSNSGLAACRGFFS